jgi:putative heme-binding domain-containing protein
VSGRCETFGLALDEVGSRFIPSTNHHALYAMPLEHRHVARNPHIPSPQETLNAADYEQIYPTSKPDPWRTARNADPRWVAFYGQREVTPNGYFTAACGPLVYGGGNLPGLFVGNHFICEPANNLIHRSDIQRDGSGFRVARAAGEENSEFISSTDRWFRPINLGTGPDGALYIIDFYREIIEDYSAIPRHLQQRYVDGLRAGVDHGRIWRVTSADEKAPIEPPMGNRTEKQWVAALSSTSVWQRETAQRLLIQRGQESDATLVRGHIRKTSTAQGRLHGLYTLEGLACLTARDVARALTDEDFGVRLHALRLAERWLDSAKNVRKKALALVSDPDPNVRLQAAQSLGACEHPDVLGALASLTIDHGQEPWMAAAIISSVATNPVSFTEVLMGEGIAPGTGVIEVLGPLGATVAAKGEEGAIAALLAMSARHHGVVPEAQVALLDGLAEGLSRVGDWHRPGAAKFEGLRKLLASEDYGVRSRALRVAGLLQLKDSSAIRQAWTEAVQGALDQDSTTEKRADAIGLLDAAPWESKAALGSLFDPREPVELQLAVVQALEDSEGSGVSDALLRSFDSLSPRVQEAILDALFEQEERLETVLEGLEQGLIVPGAIPSIRRIRLLENDSPDFRARAEKLLSPPDPAARMAVIESYQPALALAPNVARGQIIFEERCATCHQVRGLGNDVGPDLSGVSMRPDSMLLSDILNPSGVITAGFNAYTVETEDGGFYSGLLADETATSVTLRRAQGETDTVLRNQIFEMQASALSLMPDGLEGGLSHQAMADLLGYVRDAAGAAKPSGFVAFDENPAMAEGLAKGGGTAVLSTFEPYTGAVSLKVTPPRRFAQRIVGWHFRVVENPAVPDDGPIEEIRYARFAWRSEGEAILFGFADDETAYYFPPRRYYAGPDAASQDAIGVSATAPAKWTVVTVDLWKDFGSFTMTGAEVSANGGDAYIDRIEFLAALEGVAADEVLTHK